MILELNNIGLIDHGIVEISGLTIVVGKNGSGKSSIGKALYAGMKPFHNLIFKVKKQKKRYCYSVLMSTLISNYREESFERHENFGETAHIISENLFSDKVNPGADAVRKELDILNERYHLEGAIQEDLIKTITKISSITEEDVLKELLIEEFKDQFSDQIQNLYKTEEFSTVKIGIKDKNLEIKFKDQEIVDVEKPFILTSEPIYITDFKSLIPSQYRVRMPRHIADYNDILGRVFDAQEDGRLIEGILKKKSLNVIFRKFSEICRGRLKRSNTRTLVFEDSSNPQVKINPKNLASGLITFAVLFELLDGGIIQDKSTLILDEPENHLHPEWQVYLADLLTLIQREFDLHLLISTHSPYLLAALETFSKKNGISERTKFYEICRNENSSVIKELTDDLTPAYDDLSAPFQLIEDNEE